MADSVEMQEIRGLDIDKAVKGFALIDYTFKNECEVSSTSSDHIRWYQETSADLTATAPQKVANISPLSTFPTLEPTWTRNTTYIRKYAAEGFISMEDIKSADIDVIARTLLRLTRAVLKEVDTRIYTVLTQDSNILGFSGSGQFWSGSQGEIVYDLLDAKRRIYAQGYNPEGASLILNQETYRDVVNWLITSKGSSIPQFASSKIETGTVMNILGLNVKVSPNANERLALVIVPRQAATWKTHTAITSAAIQEQGIGTKLRVWELGEVLVTDPKAICLISGVEP